MQFFTKHNDNDLEQCKRVLKYKGVLGGIKGAPRGLIVTTPIWTARLFTIYNNLPEIPVGK